MTLLRARAILLLATATLALRFAPADAQTVAGPMFVAPGYEYGPGGEINSLAFADLNGDGALDMIVGGESFGGTLGINVAMGKGGGSFGPFVSSFAGPRTFVLVAGDFDGDGKKVVVLGR